MGTAAPRVLTTGKPGARTARVGRPPSVNVQAIIQAALDVGLENVTLKKVADKLGVAVATLYRHVDGRDELVRLAAFKLALARRLPEGGDGHWSELATRYALSLFTSFVDEPQLLAELMKGGLGPEIEIEFLDDFLGALAEHGFSPAEGVRLHRAVAMLTIGAAVGANAVNASRSNGRPQELAVRRALAERDASALPNLRAALPEYLNLEMQQWLPALHELLAGFAATRGETLPTRTAPISPQEDMS